MILYSFNVLPHLGQWIAGDAESYQYLAESIRMHPNQEDFKSLMDDAGFKNTAYQNMTGGIVALHSGEQALTMAFFQTYSNSYSSF